jgi:uncharacterized protein (TIGR02246 family)
VMRADTAAAPEPAREIAAIRAEYVAAVNGRQADALSALYAPDAVVVLADGARLNGSAAVKQHIARSLAGARAATVTLVPQRFEIAGSGELGAESGTFLEAAADGPAVTGAYVTIYTRAQDGRWRIAMEVRTTGAQPPSVIW